MCCSNSVRHIRHRRAITTIPISGAFIRAIARLCFASGTCSSFVRRRKTSRLKQHSLLSWQTRPVARNGCRCRNHRAVSIGLPDTWWRLVTGSAKREPVDRVHRRFFELCVFTQMMWDLKSGDAAIEGSREYADYRDQLISEEEAAETERGLPGAGRHTDRRKGVRRRKAPMAQPDRAGDGPLLSRETTRFASRMESRFLRRCFARRRPPA